MHFSVKKVIIITKFVALLETRLMPLRIFSAVVILCFLITDSLAQSAFVPLDAQYSHQVDRLEIKSGVLSNTVHTSIKPFERIELGDFLSQLDTLSFLKLNPTDKWNYYYLITDNWEWSDSSFHSISNSKVPFLKYFLKKKNDFYNNQNQDYDIHVSPIFQFAGGTNFTDNNASQFINTRGVEIRGHVNRKLGFYTGFTENQQSSPDYIADYIMLNKGFPYQGYTKVSNDDSLKLKQDFLNAQGYLVFNPSKNVMIKFGHSTNFIGNGIRSMILSDFSSPYLNLVSEVKLGRMQYFNMLAQMSNNQVDRGVNNTIAVSPKYMAFHHLNFNVTRKFNLGLYESVLFGPRPTGFELNYLNPIIFYRFVESLLGSADNAIVGADFKLNIAKSISLYGQYVLDEFNQKENKKDGWWGKKNAGQLGFKIIDVAGIKQLDWQVEYNYARPYIYSHYTTHSNYVNYNIPLAHPLGANFKEMISEFRYQAIKRLFLKGTYMYYMKGLDTDNVNYGGNILLNNREGRPSDYGNFIGQGSENKVHFVNLTASYMLMHNMFLDLGYTWRMSNFESVNSTNKLFSFGIRWNAPGKSYMF